MAKNGPNRKTLKNHTDWNEPNRKREKITLTAIPSFDPNKEQKSRRVERSLGSGKFTGDQPKHPRR